MADEYGDKTELPTDRRRSEARQKGNVARSTDLNAAGIMLAAAAAMFFHGRSCTEALAQLLRSSLNAPAWTQLDRYLIYQQSWQTLELLAWSVLPMMLVVAGTSLAINLAQVGFLWAPEVLQPKFARLNPLEGAKRILSMQGIVRLGGSLGKLLVLTLIAVGFIHGRLPHFMRISSHDTLTLMFDLGRSIGSLAFLLAMALVALALLDYGFQWWKHEQDLRMTKQEVREEMKEMDGDPLIRQRRREAHRKLTLARDLHRVKEADVVITNPTEIAVALKYDPAKNLAPIVLAKGMGEIAARIRRIAAEHRIPIIERKPLARALYKSVKVGQAIPVEMYEVFVEIMAYVYRITGRKPPNLG